MNQRTKLFFKDLLIFIVILLFFKFINKMNIFYFISIVFILVILSYLLIKIIYKNEIFFKKYEHSINLSKFIITTLISLFIVVFLSFYVGNQLVQPLFKPRIVDIEITPLHIQSEYSDPSNVTYYGFYKVDYKIQTPFFGNNKSIYLDIPDKRKSDKIWLDSTNSELLISYMESNPFYDVSFTKEEYRKLIVDVKDIEKGIPLIIYPNAKEVKEITASFYFRKKIEHYRASIDRSDPEWYSESQIAPLSFGNEFVTRSYANHIGYIVRRHLGYTYRFSTLKIKSLSDMEIKGLVISQHYDFICDGELPLNDMNGYISIDLAPKEIKVLIGLNQEGRNFETESYELVTYPTDSFSYSNICIAAWRTYEGLYKK